MRGQCVCGHCVSGSVGKHAADPPPEASGGPQSVGMCGHSVMRGGHCVGCEGQSVGRCGHCVCRGQMVNGSSVTSIVIGPATAAAFAPPTPAVARGSGHWVIGSVTGPGPPAACCSHLQIVGGHCVPFGSGQSVRGHPVIGNVGRAAPPPLASSSSAQGGQSVGSCGQRVGSGGQTVSWRGQSVATAGHSGGCGQIVRGHCVNGSVGNAAASPAASAAGWGQSWGISGHDVGVTGHSVAIGGTNVGSPPPPPPVPEVVSDGSFDALDDVESSFGRSSSLLSRLEAMDSSPLIRWWLRGGGCAGREAEGGKRPAAASKRRHAGYDSNGNPVDTR